MNLQFEIRQSDSDKQNDKLQSLLCLYITRSANKGLVIRIHRNTRTNHDSHIWATVYKNNTNKNNNNNNNNSAWTRPKVLKWIRRASWQILSSVRLSVRRCQNFHIYRITAHLSYCNSKILMLRFAMFIFLPRCKCLALSLCERRWRWSRLFYLNPKLYPVSLRQTQTDRQADRQTET